MRRILIPNYGPETEKIPKAIAVGIKQCNELKASELTLIVPHREHFPDTVVGEFLGNPQAKRLAAGKVLEVSQMGISLRCETPHSLKRNSKALVGLVFYVTWEDMKVVDSIPTFKAIIFVPWLDDDGITWQRTWDAQVIGEMRSQPKPLLDSAVEESLLRLSATINMSTGLSHPCDLRDAKRLFGDLQTKRLSADPKDIRIWAIHQGWKPRYADQLMKVAETYLKPA